MILFLANRAIDSIMKIKYLFEEEKENILKNTSILVISKVPYDLPDFNILECIYESIHENQDALEALENTFSLKLTEIISNQVQDLDENLMGNISFFLNPAIQGNRKNPQINIETTKMYNDELKERLLKQTNQINCKKKLSISRSRVIGQAMDDLLKLTIKFSINIEAQKVFDKLIKDQNIKKHNIKEKFIDLLNSSLENLRIVRELKKIEPNFYNDSFNNFVSDISMEELYKKVKRKSLKNQLNENQKFIEENQKQMAFFQSILNACLNDSSTLKEIEEIKSKLNTESPRPEYLRNEYTVIEKKLEKLALKIREETRLHESFKKTTEYRNLTKTIEDEYKRYLELKADIINEENYEKNTSSGGAFFKGLFTIGIHFYHHYDRLNYLKRLLNDETFKLIQHIKSYKDKCGEKHRLHDEVI